MSVFVVAAGGTGSKVVEALIHLCAAGLGPKVAQEINILLIDGDQENRARHRVERALKEYREMHSWSWQINTHEKIEPPLRLFRTKVNLFALAEGFGGEANEHLRDQTASEPQIAEILSLLLTEKELRQNLAAGFHGCPNLGNLIIAKYLKKHLGSGKGSFRIFMDRLKAAALEPGGHPLVLAVGSVFGGTGASVLPAVKPTIQSLFREDSDQAVAAAAASIQWGSVMMLPYFRVAKPEHEKTLLETNPDRHDLDSIFALSYYYTVALEDGADPFFLIGSERCASRRLKYSKGGTSQAARPFHQELLGAIALIDLMQDPNVQNRQVVRHFSSGDNEAETSAMARIPAPHGFTRGEVQSQLALLAHLAAFFLKTNDGNQFQKGLLEYASSAITTAWNSASERDRLAGRTALTETNSSARVAARYFGRYLTWLSNVLPSEEAGVQSAMQDANYVSLQNSLCFVPIAEINRPDGDNLVAHLCRMAICGLLREAGSVDKANFRKHHFGRPNPLLNSKKAVRVGVNLEKIGDTIMRGHGESEDVTTWYRNE